jgi:hypothetical protein
MPGAKQSHRAQMKCTGSGRALEGQVATDCTRMLSLETLEFGRTRATKFGVTTPLEGIGEMIATERRLVLLRRTVAHDQLHRVNSRKEARAIPLAI